MNLNSRKIITWIVGLAIAIGLMVVLATGCKKHLVMPEIDPHEHITAESVTSECTSPEEMHPVTRMGFPMDALVVRHKDCLGIKDMFFVIWPGENSETKRTGAKLLMLMYLDWHNSTNTSEKLTASLLKIGNIGDSDNTSHVAIYELKTEKVVQPTTEKPTTEGTKL